MKFGKNIYYLLHHVSHKFYEHFLQAEIFLLATELVRYQRFIQDGFGSYLFLFVFILLIKSNLLLSVSTFIS